MSTVAEHPALQRILGTLSGVRENSGGWEACCPGHDDDKASLSVGIGDKGGILFHCHAGCSTADIVGKLGLRMADLAPPDFSNGNGYNGNGKPKIVAAYDYRDEQGTLLYQSVRFEPKDFRQRAPAEGGGWTWRTTGLRRVPYRLPELLKADPAAIVWIPEGEKDCDRLANLGLVSTCNVGGAGKWRKEYGDHLRGRRVAILPDNDQPGTDHAQDVAGKLHGVAAGVKVVELPGLPEKGDVSDWLNAGGTVEQLAAMVEAAGEWEANALGQKTPKRSKGESTIKRLADEIAKAEHLAQDGGGRLYRYADGAYRPRGDQFIKGRVKALCLKWNIDHDWSSRLASEVVEFIRVDSPELWERPPMDVLNVKNGLLRVADRVLLPHSPKHLSTVQLPVSFDSKATCPNLEAFVGQVFPSDGQSLAWEIVGNLMLPDTSIQKAVLLIGEGSNGKSIYLGVVVVFLGKGNVSSVSLHKLEADKFSVARLLGKLANICPDLPSDHLAGTSVFKALTGNDVLTAEYKFRDSFDLTPFARLVFSANHPPRSSDASHAFYRRWLVLPFARTFSEKEQIPRDVLMDLLTSEAELSGLLNKALDARQRMADQCGFSQPESVLKAWEEFHATTDPVAVWLDKNTMEDSEVIVPMDVLRNAYNATAARDGRPPLTTTAFGLAVARLRPTIEQRQRTVNGKVKWCYIGLGLVAGDGNGSRT